MKKYFVTPVIVAIYLNNARMYFLVIAYFNCYTVDVFIFLGTIFVY